MCVAILHDVVEDSKITVKQIREIFGDRIARGVGAVSKDRSLTLPKNLERVADAADAGAPDVRLADRIDNVRTSVYRHQPDKVLQPIDEAERYFLPFAKVHNPALRAELIKAVGHAIYLVRDVGRYGKDDFRGVLRTAVLDVHKALGELELLAHLDSPEITIDYYLRYLKRVWGLIEPIERELTKSPLASEGFGLTERIAWKAERIRKDMTALGVADVEIDNLPCIEPVPALNTLPKTLGVIYAIEGSMLGGVAIRGNVESALTLSETSGASFLNTYGDVKSTTTHVSAFMNSLTALVDRAPDPKRIQEEIVVSAVDMFIRTHDWYS